MPKPSDRTDARRRHEIDNPARSATGLPAIANTVNRSLSKMGLRRTVATLSVINQPVGFDCPGCAWPEAAPDERHRIEFCESGAKAVAEEATTARIDRDFFTRHSIADLRNRSDFWLGEAGRLTSQMIKRPGATHYEPIEWADAFTEIDKKLRGLDDPNRAIFYTSGRTGNEAAFLYQLLARSFGTNNLPDCSNMCHEPTTFALGRSIGIGKGSVQMADFALADVILVVGQNPGSNHPRMLTTLEEASRGGTKIIAINPLPEAGLLRYKNPQTVRGLMGHGTELANIHLPIRLGGDQALFQLWNRRLTLAAAARPAAIDQAFIAEHTAGFDALADHLATVDEAALLEATGLDESAVDDAFAMIAGASRLIVCWAMGITQHIGAVDTIDEMTNLALLGGHIGRPGAGLSPIRGHSNVQGDRTMGIFERPEPELLDALEHEFGVPMPRASGLDTLAAVNALANGDARIMIGLGGNFVRATPDSNLTERALSGAQLTVQISTKLNRSHLMCGATAIILPTHGRTDADTNDAGENQFVTVEDSMGIVHPSTGVLTPPSPEVRSEVAIVSGLALALLGPDHAVGWTALGHSNDLIRDRIANVIPGFESFNTRVRVPGGFVLPHPPRDSRTFPTRDGKAQFTITTIAPPAAVDGQLMLQTLRSHDQYNTTIYGHHDRYRGIAGDRHIIMINPADIARLGLTDGQTVDLVSLLAGPDRRTEGYRIVAYPTPLGCAAAYYPETNVLIALDHHGPHARTPAAKAVPIRLEPTRGS
ncbi:MAG: FdhF/YdeP family oxidoreductase [Ilumatobacteraceae bacterium]|nr:FdhF/YdeP family oxidoreductase [Ilumatobacteraceae bacterium]